VRQLGGRPIDRIFELRVQSQNETVLRSIRSTGIALVDDRSKAMGVLCIFEDVSDAARLEKLAAWQEVAKRVAHEIKNPLTPIQISADRLMRRMGQRMEADEADGPIFKECLGQIQKQVRVIRDLVREFSQFAKLPEPRFERIQVSQFLTGVLNDYRFTHPAIKFEFFPQKETDQVFVRGDPEYLRRLVVNLADNAIGSMDEAHVKDPTFSVTIDVSSRAEGFVGIFFKDNGPGIPKDLRDKIFDPYVSSKASGLGLGLPIVRRIAIEHMGRIRCEESATGACFVLELPLLSLNDEGAKYGQISTHR
jgi:two-component system nitrogen regulation sensor histidine kinase NtrY